MTKQTSSDAVMTPKTGVIWCLVGADLTAELVLAVVVNPALFKLMVVRLWLPSGMPPVELVRRDDVVPGWTPPAELVEGPPDCPGTVWGLEVCVWDAPLSPADIDKSAIRVLL